MTVLPVATGFLYRLRTQTIIRQKVYYNCSNRKFVPVGTIPSHQTPFFFLSDKCELTAGSDGKKNTVQPHRGIELGSSDCRSDALTTELRNHDRNCVRIFVFHQTVSSFFGGAALCFFFVSQIWLTRYSTCVVCSGKSQRH